ncbi:MAG: hypothetical protein HKO57_15935, partial [Akkermansiaceae bacterium]|nr:hypothetical protein [Akkermansiaceae bacterium]
MLRSFLILLAIPIAFASDVIAQAPASSGAPTAESIEAEAKSVAARTDLSEDVKTAARQSYDAALAALEAAAASEAQASGFRDLLQTAAADAAAATAEAAAIVVPADPAEALTEAERNLEIADRSNLLAREEAALAKAEAALADLDASLDAQKVRPQAIVEESAEARDQERAALNGLTALNGAEGPAETAERTRLRAQLAASRARQAALEQEGTAAPALRSLLQARQELQSRIVARAKARVGALRALVKESVEDIAQAAEKLAGETVQPGTLAAEVKEYADELKGVTDRITKARSAREEHSEMLKRLEIDVSLVAQKTEASGGGGAAAQALLDQSRALPDPRRLRREQKAGSAATAEVRFARVKIDAALERLENEPPPESGRARELHDTKMDLLVQLSEQYALLIAEMGKLDLVKSDYVEKLETFSRLLNEKLFWVRSSPPLSVETVAQLPAAVAWVAGPSRPARLMWALGAILQRAPVQIGGLGLLAVVLFFLRPRMRRRVASHLPLIRRISGDRYSFTLEALGLVLLVALPFSLLMWAAGRQLLFIPEAGDWTQGIAQGLQRASVVLATFMFLRELSRKDGLAETHFKWKPSVTRRLKRAATGFAWFYVPATVVLLMVFTEGTGQHMHSLGRLLFIAAMTWVAAWAWFMLHPDRGIFSEFLRKNATGIVARLRYIWFAAVVLAPLALAGLAAWGYLVTALRLSSYLHGTAAIGIGAVVAYHLMLRYFTMRERKIALERTLAERKA